MRICNFTPGILLITTWALASCTPFKNFSEVLTLGDPKAFKWEFTDTQDYAFDQTQVNVSGARVVLLGTDQTDDDNTAAGFGASGMIGAAWDGSNQQVRLHAAGGCDGRLLPCAMRDLPEIYELNASWTPQWGNLVSYWPMDGNWNDRKGSAHGTPLNGATFTANSRVGSGAASFDGVDAIAEFGNTLDFTSEDFTFSFWIKVNSFTPNVYAFGKGTFMTDGYFLQVGAGNLQFYSNQSGTRQTYTSARSGSTSSWEHIAVVRTGTVVKLYSNGREVPGAGSGIQNPLSTTSSFKIGGIGSPTANAFIDEFAAWSTTLTSQEILKIYQRQATRFSGAVHSRVMDAGQNSMSWTQLGWVTPLPFLKELPDAACAAGTTCPHMNDEVKSDYADVIAPPSVNSSDLMNGIVGLWHLNEPLWNGTPGEVKDTSGSGYNGTVVGGGLTTQNDGRFSRAAQFNSTSYIETFKTPTQLGLSGNSPRTISLWVYPQGLLADPFSLFIMGSGGVTGGEFGLDYRGSSNWRLQLWGSADIDFTLTQFNDWIHLAVTHDGTTAKIFADGLLIQSQGVTLATGDAQTFKIGSGQYPGNFGLLDEVALWTRALAPEEVVQLYRRGANRLKAQVRTCTLPDCSDDTANLNWKGPDGTSQSFFSEMNNNTHPLSITGLTQTTAPKINFLDYPSPPGTARFFQYRLALESDDNSGSLCQYGGAPASCSPEVKSLSVDPIHFYKNSPPVTMKTGVRLQSFSGFADTVSTSCPAGVTYNLGFGPSYAAAHWHYWSGAAWLPANATPAESNDAATISQSLSSFNKISDSESIFVRAFLRSDGTTPCELDEVKIYGRGF